jgi:hypothetical protein
MPADSVTIRHSFFLPLMLARPGNNCTLLTPILPQELLSTLQAAHPGLMADLRLLVAESQRLTVGCRICTLHRRL